MARDPGSYHSWSNQAERQLCGALAADLRQGGNLAEPNLRQTLAGDRREIDLVVFEPSTRTLWLIQVKAMIPPDTPLEVMNGNRTVEVGLTQLERDRRAVSEAGSGMLMERLGQRGVEPMTVRYLLACSGFIGSDYLQLPDFVNVVTVEALQLAARRGESVSTLVQGFQEELDSRICWLKALPARPGSYQLAGMTVVTPDILEV